MIWKLSDRLSHIFLLPKSNLLDQQLCIECILIFICNVIWKKIIFWEMWIILLNMCWIPSYIKKNAFTSYRSHFFSFLIHVFENCTVKLLLFLLLLLFCICSYICILFFENSATELLSFFPNKIRHTPSPKRIILHVFYVTIPVQPFL